MIQSSMEFSLILPAYNTSAYLADCVLSCENQDLDHSQYEIIIVNDGSTDSTIDVAQKLSERYTNIRIISQDNQGLSMARNNGAAIAHGRYIWFIDSDDKISQNCLNGILKILHENDLDMFGVAPSIPFKSQFPDDINYDLDITNVVSGRDWLLSGKSFIGAWAYVIKTDFWRKQKFQFYPGLYFEDTELMPKVQFKASRIASFDTFSCYNYIQRAGSIMHSEMSTKKLFDISRIINSHYKFITENLKEDKLIAQIFEKGRTSSYLAAINAIAKKKDKQLLSEWLVTLINRPKMICATNPLKKLYQWFILKHPAIYCSIR